jgi:hypothetical protein
MPANISSTPTHSTASSSVHSLGLSTTVSPTYSRRFTSSSRATEIYTRQETDLLNTTNRTTSDTENKQTSKRHTITLAPASSSLASTSQVYEHQQQQYLQQVYNSLFNQSNQSNQHDPNSIYSSSSKLSAENSADSSPSISATSNPFAIALHPLDLERDLSYSYLAREEEEEEQHLQLHIPTRQKLHLRNSSSSSFPQQQRLNSSNISSFPKHDSTLGHATQDKMPSQFDVTSLSLLPNTAPLHGFIPVLMDSSDNPKIHLESYEDGSSSLFNFYEDRRQQYSPSSFRNGASHGDDYEDSIPHRNYREDEDYDDRIARDDNSEEDDEDEMEYEKVAQVTVAQLLNNMQSALFGGRFTKARRNIKQTLNLKVDYSIVLSAPIFTHSTYLAFDFLFICWSFLAFFCSYRIRIH